MFWLRSLNWLRLQQFLLSFFLDDSGLARLQSRFRFSHWYMIGYLPVHIAHWPDVCPTRWSVPSSKVWLSSPSHMISNFHWIQPPHSLSAMSHTSSKGGVTSKSCCSGDFSWIHLTSLPTTPLMYFSHSIYIQRCICDNATFNWISSLCSDNTIQFGI